MTPQSDHSPEKPKTPTEYLSEVHYGCGCEWEYGKWIKRCKEHPSTQPSPEPTDQGTRCGKCNTHHPYNAPCTQPEPPQPTAFEDITANKLHELRRSVQREPNSTVATERVIRDILAAHNAAISQAVEASYQDGYKKGVADEIECVETSGEHLDLRANLKENRHE